MGVKVTLGGEPLALKVGQSLNWQLGYGTSPSVFTLDTTADSAERIRVLARRQFGKGRLRDLGGDSGPLTLLIEDAENNRKVEAKGIYAVVANRPGADYNTRSITLADQRWLWERTFIERSYNIRRKTGSFRLIRNSMADVQISRQRADFGYRAATLNGVGQSAKPWTATEVLEDILQELCGKNGYVIDAAKKFGIVDSIEGLELHDSGPGALNRVLSYIPGARVYIGYDGKCHVASIYDGTEFDVFEGFGAGNTGDWRVVDKSQMRPAGGYTVFSDREVELRFDYVEEREGTEDAPAVTTTVVRDRELEKPPLREPQWLENVIINPLYTLQLDAGGTRFASLGEPIPLDQFIDAFNLTTFNPLGFIAFEPFSPDRANISKKILRDFWLGAKWGLLRQYTCLTTAKLFNPERLKLLEALRAGFRQIYRVLPQWRDKVRAIKADRAAILDYETGTRAPASVFTQYTQIWSQLGYNPNLQDTGTGTINEDWAEDIGERHNSPFTVEIMDSDMGLFRLAPRVDQTGLATTFILGIPKDGVVPAADKRNAIVMWTQVDLDPEFKMAVVLSAIQDVPNSEGRLHSEAVTLKEAAALLKVEIPESRGPLHELVQTAETARYAWIDSSANQIRDAFFEGKPYPASLMVNPREIKALSVAAAAAKLVTQLDKVEGRVTGPMVQITPTGNLRTVTHSVTVGRDNSVALFTTLTAPGDVPGQNIYALLPEGIRRKVRRLVQP